MVIPEYASKICYEDKTQVGLMEIGVECNNEFDKMRRNQHTN